MKFRYHQKDENKVQEPFIRIIYEFIRFHPPIIIEQQIKETSKNDMKEKQLPTVQKILLWWFC